MWKKLFLLLLVPLMFTGCAGTFTNLSARQQPRNPNNLYSVGVAFHTRQKSLRWESIQPMVVVNGENYPLRKTPIVENRWEGLIPVAPGTKAADYHFVFKYQYDYFGGPRSESAMSPNYHLNILGQ
ncbi:MAG: hypothetical protein EPO07_10005 [Verrucomicrobia bacterium]|nr:MAG: hypothetical protein EPO07_10005 [Verrucomicrobiota bacterium]